MRIRSVFHATAFVLLAGCNSITQACTLMACQDGLEVKLSGTPAGAYTVEASSEFRVLHKTYECAAGQTCPPIFFEGFDGEDVTVRVTTAAGVRTQTFENVKFERRYPNGRDCGGTCRQASVTVQL